MQLLDNWPPPGRSTPLGKRKRTASIDQNGAEVATKSSILDDENRGDNEGDSLHFPSNHSLNVRSPIGQGSLPSTPGQKDLQQQNNEAFSHNGRILSPNSLSRSPEHASNAESPQCQSRHVLRDRQSLEDGRSPKPLQINTARAISALDPRSPSYEMASKTVRGFSDGQRRRQSETGPPLTADVRRESCSKDLTPMSASTTKAASQNALPSRYRESLTSGFSGLAQTLMSASGINVKLDQIDEAGAQTEAENGRIQNFHTSYNSLLDRARLRQDASQSAKTRLSERFEEHAEAQTMIASALDSSIKRPLTNTGNDPDISENLPAINRNIAEIRRDLKANQTSLEYQERKWLRQVDLDRYAQKAVQHDDLAQFATKEVLSKVEDTLKTLNLDIKILGGKLSDLILVGRDRYDEAQTLQLRNSTRLDELDLSTAKSHEIESKIEENLGFEKEASRLRETNLEKLQQQYAELREAVHGNMEQSQIGLAEALKSNANQLAETKKSADHLAQRILKLEQAAREKEHSRSPTASQSTPNDEVMSLRLDLNNLAADQEGGHTLLLGDMQKLETSLGICHDKVARLEEVALKQLQNTSEPSAATQKPGFPPMDASLVRIDSHHVKLEQLETEVKALNTHVVVQKKQFDNLTTEHLAQNIINQTKKLYKEHPGFVQDELKVINGRISHTDKWISGTLEPRLFAIEELMRNTVSASLIPDLYTRFRTVDANVGLANQSIVRMGQDVTTKLNAISVEIDRQRESLARIEPIVAQETKRLDKLQGDIEILNRDLYLAISANPIKQDLLREPLVQTPDPESATGTAVREHSNQPESTPQDESKTPDSRGEITPPSREDSITRRPDRDASISTDESHALSNCAKRKRHSFFVVSDSESDRDSNAARKTPRSKE